MTAEKKPPFVMVVVTMKKPYGILYLSHPTKKQVLETITDLLAGTDDLDDYFEVTEFDISEDVEGAFADP